MKVWKYLKAPAFTLIFSAVILFGITATHESNIANATHDPDGNWHDEVHEIIKIIKKGTNDELIEFLDANPGIDLNKQTLDACCGFEATALLSLVRIVGDLCLSPAEDGKMAEKAKTLIKYGADPNMRGYYYHPNKGRNVRGKEYPARKLAKRAQYLKDENSCSIQDPHYTRLLAVLESPEKYRDTAPSGGSAGGGSSTQTEEAKADATPLYSCVSPEEADSQQDKLPTDSKVQYFPPDLGKDLCYNCNQEDLDKWNKPDCALFGFNDLESSVYNNCDAPLVVGWCNRENRGDEKCERLDWSYTLEHEDRLQVNHFNFDEDGTVLYAFCYAPQRPKVNP